eukprot:m.71115 g.71115  ORF g.71115 m.71115 type:complete len:397 (-) comp14345_c0_seq1:251-1441(-)
MASLATGLGRASRATLQALASRSSLQARVAIASPRAFSQSQTTAFFGPFKRKGGDEGAEKSDKAAESTDNKQQQQQPKQQQQAKAEKPKVSKPQPDQPQQKAQASASSSSSKNAEEQGTSSGPFTKLVQFAKVIKDELIEPSAEVSRPYASPSDRRRSAVEKSTAAPIKEDTTTTGLVVHSESKWTQQWNEFKDNNPVANALFGLRMKFDESDNIVVRAARTVTDTVSEKLGGVFEEGDMAQTMQEIYRLDPSFNVEAFTKHLQMKVIPAVLEAFLAGDLNTLKEWCSETCYSMMAAQIEQRKQAGLSLDGQILDLRNVDLLVGKVMEQGPVLMFSFITQQVMVVRDASGAVREGGEDKIERALYVIAMRRDQTQYDPNHAWQVMDFGMQGATSTW